MQIKKVAGKDGCVCVWNRDREITEDNNGEYSSQFGFGFNWFIWHYGLQLALQ